MSLSSLWEEELKELFSQKERRIPDRISFLGFGAYEHFIPSCVDHIASLRAFKSAYTPYQPEVSQGILQALFEFQSLLVSITGMEVSNSSLYDGATSLVEAVRMALRIEPPNKRKKILYPYALHPYYKEVLFTYFPLSLQKDLGIEFLEVPIDPITGETNWESFSRYSSDIHSVILQNPNVFGIWEEGEKIKKLFPDAFFLYGTLEPFSFLLRPSPGEIGVDILWAELQPWGVPLSWGGPYVGVLMSKKKYVRQLPGRLVGYTKGKNFLGEDISAYLIVLSTREQHIRREKATSNICSNQTLMAIRVAVYLSVLGYTGLKKLLRRSLLRRGYFQEKFLEKGGRLLFGKGRYFHEIAYYPLREKEVEENGLLLGKEIYYGEDKILISYFSELRKEEEIKRLLECVAL